MIVQKIPEIRPKFINNVKDTGQEYDHCQNVVQHRRLGNMVAQQQDQEIYKDKYGCKTAFISFDH